MAKWIRCWNSNVTFTNSSPMLGTAIYKLLKQFCVLCFACVFLKIHQKTPPLPSDVYANGSKISHIGGKCVFLVNENSK